MNLLKSTGTFGFYTIISRLLGYLRDILIAIFLGTGLLADAFFVAFRIPNTFRRLFSEGTFNAAFVPSYASEMVKGKKQSNEFANDIFNLLFLSLFIITLLVQLFMPVFVSLIAPGFVGDIEKMEIAITLTRITFPFLLFICLASFFAAILNSHNKFAAASGAPIILNIVLVLVLLFSNSIGDSLVYYRAAHHSPLPRRLLRRQRTLGCPRKSSRPPSQEGGHHRNTRRSDLGWREHPVFEQGGCGEGSLSFRLHQREQDGFPNSVTGQVHQQPIDS